MPRVIITNSAEILSLRLTALMKIFFALLTILLIFSLLKYNRKIEKEEAVRVTVISKNKKYSNINKSDYFTINCKMSDGTIIDDLVVDEKSYSSAKIGGTQFYSLCEEDYRPTTTSLITIVFIISTIVSIILTIFISINIEENDTINKKFKNYVK